MTTYAYKVVPAPKKGVKAKGLKTAGDRFANALQTVMNDMGADGWEYQRTDTMPCEERVGLTGRSTSFQTMLVFRKAILAEEKAPAIVMSPALRVTETLAAPAVTAAAAPLVASRPLDKDPARPDPQVAAE